MTKHQCFACDEKNPDRIVTNTDDGWTFKFIERFVGPTGRAHGGTAIGALTCPALQLAERDGMHHPVVLHVNGRLNLPVPVAKPICVKAYSEEGRYRVQLHGDSNVILDGFVEVADRETKVGSVLQDPPSEYIEDLQSLSEIVDGDIKGPSLFTKLLEVYKVAGSPWEPPPKCFGCSEGDGALKLSLRKTSQGDTYTRWESEVAFTDGDGRLATTMVVAAIDCINLHAINANDDFDLAVKLLQEKKGYMTGTYGVRFLRVPPVEIEDDYRITSRYIRRDGRKLFTISALIDSKGTIYAMGESVAIIFPLPDEILGTKSKNGVNP
jgi:hypothetical protein